MHRYLKQRQWDAEKRDQQQLKQLRLVQQQEQFASEDKQRGQNAAKARRGQERKEASASDGNTQRTLRAVRMKTCRRCSERYMPGLNESDSCRWHRGQYVSVHSDSEAVDCRSHCMSNTAATKKVQQLLKTNSHKKKSKQHNVDVAEGWAWSCCGATSMLEPGCAKGPHN